MTHPCEELLHETVYENNEKIALSLPLTDELKSLHSTGTFPIVENPSITKKALIMGMFVMRPARDTWTTPVSDFSSLYNIRDWCFNFKGLDGGGLIADGSVVDGYRLALHYGICDAVMVGSQTIAAEAHDVIQPDGSIRKGYLWQPYNPCSWPNIAAADDMLLERIYAQRALLQSLGHISSRKFPAQVFITWSGVSYDNGPDILNVRALSDKHPDGETIEVYIVSSTNGCKQLRNRAALLPHLSNRIDSLLIELSPEGQPDEIDLTRLPYYLYEKLDMRIVNHDGGKRVLQRFCQANVLSQMNITLARQRSVWDVITTSKKLPQLTPDAVTTAKGKFESNAEIFFNNSFPTSEVFSESGNPSGALPKTFIPISVISDRKDEVAVVAFDCRTATDF